MDSPLEDGSMRRGPEGLPPKSSSSSPSLTGTLTEDSGSETRSAEDAGLLALWRERAIDLRRLTRPLRLAVAVSILAALVSAALIILRDVPQAHLLIFVSGDQPNAPIPTAAFAVAFALWLVAWSAALTGALFGHWALRLFVIATFLYISIPSAQLHNGIELIYLAPLFVVVLWMVVISLLQWHWHRIARSLPRWLPVVTFGMVLVCLAAHYALVWWVANLSHVATKFLTLLISNEFQAYTFVLVPVLFLTGSDFAEWAEAVSGQGTALLRRFRSTWPLAGATIFVALAIVLRELIHFGTIAHFDLGRWVLHLVSLSIYGCIAILLVVGITRLGKMGNWPWLAVPPSALVAATIIMMGLLVAPVYLYSFFVTLNTYLPSAPHVETFLVDLNSQLTAPIVFGMIPLAFGLLLGGPLLMRGRQRPGPLAVAGLFLVLLGLQEALLFLPQLIALFGVPTDRIILFALGGHVLRLSQIPTLSVPVLQTLAAFFTLAIAGWYIVRRRIGDGRATRVLAALLLLNVGLQIISWIDLALSGTDQLANRFTVAQGVLLVLAFLWDLLTSGEQVTNAHGRLTPRFARVLIYVGYSLLSFSEVLFFTTLRGSPVANSLSGWPDLGLTTLGPVVLLTIVLLRLARSRATPTDLGGDDEGTLEQGVYVRSGLEPVGSSPTSPA
jgi:hypothetical protein